MKTHLNNPLSTYCTHITQYHSTRKIVLGFTLIELLITMTMSLILGFIGIPNLMDFYQQQSANTATSEIRRTLAVARQYAVSTQHTVTLCGISDSSSCTNNDIKNLIIFIDVNTNKTLDDDEVIVLNRELTNKGYIRLSASLAAKYIEFRRDGSAKQAGSFIYCVKDKPELSRRVTLSLMGRAYTGKAKSSDGIVTLLSGKAITC